MGATVFQITDSDIIFYIQKIFFQSHKYFSLRQGVIKSVFPDMAAMTVEESHSSISDSP